MDKQLLTADTNVRERTTSSPLLRAEPWRNSGLVGKVWLQEESLPLQNVAEHGGPGAEAEVRAQGVQGREGVQASPNGH